MQENFAYFPLNTFCTFSTIERGSSERLSHDPSISTASIALQSLFEWDLKYIAIYWQFSPEWHSKVMTESGVIRIIRSVYCTPFSVYESNALLTLLSKSHFLY